MASLVVNIYCILIIDVFIGKRKSDVKGGNDAPQRLKVYTMKKCF